MGNTYGLANCAQAVQADVIGSAIILFVGQLLMVSTVRSSQCKSWILTLYTSFTLQQ